MTVFDDGEVAKNKFSAFVIVVVVTFFLCQDTT